MEHVFFRPWVGKDYDSGGIFGKKILVLGESHYCGGCQNCGYVTTADECANYTSEKTVIPYLNGESVRFSGTFKKFEKAMWGKDVDDKKRHEIWHSVVFYNYLQISVEETRKGGLWEDYRNSEGAFFEVIDKYRPELIIAWGVSRFYYNMPGGDRWVPGEKMEYENYSIKNGKYKLSDGTEAPIVWIYHPSTGFSPEWWHHVISIFLK